MPKESKSSGIEWESSIIPQVVSVTPDIKAFSFDDLPLISFCFEFIWLPLEGELRA